MTLEISIHAPLTGSDYLSGAGGGRGGDFNPRSPYGERQRWSCIPNFLTRFQSTLPLRGATPPDKDVTDSQDISIHAPLTGSDPGGIFMRYSDFISIHAPLTGSDRGEVEPSERVGISIHAPLTGSDYFRAAAVSQLRLFQSTLPLRGATTPPENAKR